MSEDHFFCFYFNPLKMWKPLTNGVEKTGYPHAKKMKLNPLPYIILQKLTQWIKDLNKRTKTIKLLEESIGEKLYDSGFGNAFLHMIPKA